MGKRACPLWGEEEVKWGSAKLFRRRATPNVWRIIDVVGCGYTQWDRVCLKHFTVAIVQQLHCVSNKNDNHWVMVCLCIVVTILCDSHTWCHVWWQSDEAFDWDEITTVLASKSNSNTDWVSGWQSDRWHFTVVVLPHLRHTMAPLNAQEGWLSRRHNRIRNNQRALHTWQSTHITDEKEVHALLRMAQKGTYPTAYGTCVCSIRADDIVIKWATDDLLKTNTISTAAQCKSLRSVILLAQTTVNMPHMHLVPDPAAAERQGCFEEETLYCTCSVSQRKFYYYWM